MGENKEFKVKIYWSVNQYRKDKRTGPIDPEPRSEYLKQLFKEEEQRLK
jgi:hypothetical protein